MTTPNRRFRQAGGRGHRTDRRPQSPYSFKWEGHAYEIPLPRALKAQHLPKGSSVALVKVDRNRLKFQFLRSEPEDPGLTKWEETLLARSGVDTLSDTEVEVVEAQMAAEYKQVREASLSVDEAAQRLQVNTSRIRQRLAENSLYGIKDSNAWRLPAFQFTGDSSVPGIETVLKRLPRDISAIAVVRWFNTPNPDLHTRDHQERPRTPLNWLLSGGSPDAAAELAAEL